MSSILVNELKVALEDIPDDYEVLMHIKHKYPISREQGEKGWGAYINGIRIDDDYKLVELMN